MAQKLSSVQQWVRRRRLAAVTGLIALCLQVLASLIPVSAMADMAAAEIGQMPLCMSDSGAPANQPAKSDQQNQFGHHCQICLSLQLLSASVTPTETAAASPEELGETYALPAADRIAAIAGRAGFLSRAPPRLAKSLS